MDFTRQDLERSHDLIMAALREHREETREGLGAISTHLRELNGKTAAQAAKIAVLEERSKSDLVARVLALIAALLGVGSMTVK